MTKSTKKRLKLFGASSIALCLFTGVPMIIDSAKEYRTTIENEENKIETLEFASLPLFITLTGGLTLALDTEKNKAYYKSIGRMR